MLKAVVFGIGNNYKAHKSLINERYEITGFVDNNSVNHGILIDGHAVTAPETIMKVEYDLIIVTPAMPARGMITLQLIDMGVDIEKIIDIDTAYAVNSWMQYRHIFGVYTRSNKEKLISSVCRPTDLDRLSSWENKLSNTSQGNLIIRDNGVMLTQNRKTWEFVYVCQALEERGMLRPGMRGLGFAVGKEPLPAIFANSGCMITATDAPPEISGSGWQTTNQHSDCLNDLYYQYIVELDKFTRNVTFKYIDMNNIPSDENGYDFLWSCCALEHIGSLHAAKDFIYRAMNCLHAGGIAVHTMEYNLSSSFDTLLKGDISVMRSIDLIEVAEQLCHNGHVIEPLDFRLDGSIADDIVALPPFIEPHFKLMLGKYVVTSFGMIIQKKPL